LTAGSHGDPAEALAAAPSPRVVLVNHSDATGGAARAAYRLLTGLRQAGSEVAMVASESSTGDPSVAAPEGNLGRAWAALRAGLDRAPVRLLAPRAQALFSPAWLPDRLRRRLDAHDPDVIHLHWVTGGMVRVESLARLGRPIVWTLHDMWPFTGGCHYDDGCGRFEQACGRCPVLGSSSRPDLSRWVMRRKRRTLRSVPFTLVTPSRWMADAARRSSLLGARPVHVIPNGLDLDVFRPHERALARSLFGLDPDRRYLLFAGAGAGEPRKGLDLLLAALERLVHSRGTERPELLVLGGGPLPALPLPARALGVLRDDLSMVLALAAADAVVIPSREDNLPNVAVEAQACGRPCVGFAVGGVPEIVRHLETGWLARPADADDLAAGIAWVLEDQERWHALGTRGRHLAEATFDLRLVAKRHTDLYTELAGRQRRAGAA
jgi:glycosyltransferase involved in cell wall biosynthesis